MQIQTLTYLEEQMEQGESHSTQLNDIKFYPSILFLLTLEGELTSSNMRKIY